MNRPNVDILLEKYVGKQSEAKLIEKEFDKLIKYIKSNHITLGRRIQTGDNKLNKKMTTNDIMKRPELKKIERYSEKLFNIRKCILNVQAKDKGNASTFIASSMFFDIDYKTDKKGLRSNETLTIAIIMSTALVTVYDLNAAELTAIYLHEVGHNFYNSIFEVIGNIPIIGFSIIDSAMSYLSKIPSIGPVIDSFRLNKVLYSFKTLIERAVSLIPGFTRVRDWLIAFVDFITSIAYVDLHKLGEVLISGLKNPIGIVTRYSEEKYADSFAIDYGYGPELATALNKMSIQKNTINHTVREIPIISWVYDLSDVLIENILTFVAGYPLDSNRIRTCLDRLKRSSKDPDLDPRIRKELEKQINELEDFYYNKYLNIEENENKKRIFTFVNRLVAEKLCDGKMDLRELIYSLEPTKYK